MKRETEPEAPESIPQYVVDGLKRQDAETLKDIARFIDELRAWQDRAVNLGGVVDEDEELIEVGEVEDKRGTIVKKRVPCGKDCGGCPHGPYRYLAYREGSKVKTEYLGPAEN